MSISRWFLLRATVTESFEEDDVSKKIEALSQYKTYQDRYYFNSELTRSIMVRHGALAEIPFAEGFDILRIVGKFGE